MRKIVAISLAVLGGCTADDEKPAPGWGEVEAELDQLTGERTGMFRVYGPTANLVGGRDTIPVTVGYYCHMDPADGLDDLARTRDGIFLKVSLPDTSLAADDAHYDRVRGELGLLDVARIAVDGRVYPWNYELRRSPGVWHLDGIMAVEAPAGLSTLEARSYRLAAAGEDARLVSPARHSGIASREMDTWPPLADYAASHYRGRDTLAVELRGVVKVPLEGIDEAMESARFWCPVAQSVHEWNDARSAHISALDSTLAAAAAWQAEDQRRRVAAAKAEEEQATIDQAVRRCRPLGDGPAAAACTREAAEYVLRNLEPPGSRDKDYVWRMLLYASRQELPAPDGTAGATAVCSALATESDPIFKGYRDPLREACSKAGVSY